MIQKANNIEYEYSGHYRGRRQGEAKLLRAIKNVYEGHNIKSVKLMVYDNDDYPRKRVYSLSIMMRIPENHEESDRIGGKFFYRHAKLGSLEVEKILEIYKGFKFDGVDFSDSYMDKRRDLRQPEVELSFRREVKA